MSNKHTPGPWLIETFMRPTKGEVTQVAAFSEDGNRILCCVVESFKKIEDSRLIAAAPELLEALKAVLNEFAKDGHGGEFEDGEHPYVDAARAAIAKATGEQ